MRAFESVLRKRLIVVAAGRFWIQRQAKLLVPVESKSSSRKSVVANPCILAVPSQICGVGGDLVGDHALLHILCIGQAEMLLGRYVTEHCGTAPASQRCTNGTSDVIVAWRDIGDQWPEHVERRLVAFFHLPFHVHVDLIHRHMARAFHHDLTTFLPSAASQFTENVQFCKLRFITGIGNRSWAKAVAETPRHIVFAEDIAEVLEVSVERILLAVRHHPASNKRTAAAHNARDPVHR